MEHLLLTSIFVKDKTPLSCIVYNMAADDLMLRRARASGATVLTYIFWNIMVSASNELNTNRGTWMDDVLYSQL